MLRKPAHSLFRYRLRVLLERETHLSYNQHMALTTEIVQQRALETFELFEAGLEMVRARLRREHPDATEEDIESLLREWLRCRPGAEHGDAGPDGYRPGRVGP